MSIDLALLNAFPVWKNVRLGVYKSADEYRRALEAGSARKANWIDEIIGNPAFTCAASEVQMELVAPSVGDLGFAEGALDSKVRARAINVGLRPCPVEVLPALQLAAQETGERVIIATNAIPGSEGDLEGFDVTFGQGGLRLNGDCGPIDRLRDAKTRVAFVRPKA
jgi:hypothetical protein